jgi:hypothetical protein
MHRVTITLALCVFLALLGCGKPDASRVRLVKAHKDDCHLTLNGVHIPDADLIAKAKKQRGDRAAASVGNDELRCEGAIITLRQAGIKTDEFPKIDLGS